MSVSEKIKRSGSFFLSGKNRGYLRSGILDSFCGVLELEMLQFCCTERVSPRNPRPHSTFAACLVKKIHFSSKKVSKFSRNLGKKTREIRNFFQLLSPSNPRPEVPPVFSTKEKNWYCYRKAVPPLNYQQQPPALVIFWADLRRKTRTRRH